MFVLLRQIRRKPFLWTLLAALLTLAVAVLLVGLSSWSAIRQQIAGVTDNYVTIAIFKNYEIDQAFYNEAAMEAAMQTGCVLSEDSRCMLGVAVENSRALTSGAVNINDYEAMFDRPSYALSVLAITCTSVEPYVPEEQEVNVISEYDADGNFVREYEEKVGLRERYTMYGTVNEVISLAEGYEAPKRGDPIAIEEEIYNEDGTVPFEAGKTYLIYGEFDDHQIVYHFYDSEDEVTGEPIRTVVEEPDTESPYTFMLSDCWGLELKDDFEGERDYEVIDGLDKIKWLERLQLGQRDDGIYYYYPLPECWTHYVEYTGSVADFLASEAGREWREEIIPRCELNQRSASVVLTDNISDIYMFNNGFSEVVDGREMKPEEYVNGSDVCLVSVEYAKYNGLKVGDRINIDYYDTTVVQGSVDDSGPLSKEANLLLTLTHGILTPENRIGVQKDYEIVGIYSAPAFRGGTHLYTADTIFAPKKSLPNAEQYETREHRRLQSLVLRNGSEEEFFEKLKHCKYDGEYAEIYYDDPNDIDFSNDFMTFNQQYDKAAGNIAVMQSNARRLLILSMLGFLIVLAAVRYFEARRQRGIVLTMKKLGIAKRRITCELIGAGLLLDVIATLLGGGLAWLLFGEITRRANVGTLQLPVTTLILSAAAALLLLTATTIASAAKLSRIGLMQTKK